MRTTFVVIGSILIVLGILMIPFQFTQQSRETKQWNYETSRVGMSSFSVYLTSGYYYITLSGGGWETASPPYLEIWDSAGNRIYRIENIQETYHHYFTITSSGNYDFRIYRMFYITTVTSTIYKQSSISQIVYPFTGILGIGVVISLAGIGVLVYGVIARAPLRKVVPTPLTTRFCPQCGSAVTEEARFCYNCGKELKTTRKSS